jgi:hypothetical protein
MCRNLAGMPVYYRREDYDFLSLRDNNGVKRLLEADNIVLADKAALFSDYIVRVNSHEERKVRILLVTNEKLYILIQKQKHRTEYSIKACFQLKHIPIIEIATNNALLLNIHLDNR